MAGGALLDARPLQQFDYGQNLDSLIATMVGCFNQARPTMSEGTCLALTTSHIGEPIKKRCGRQYSKAYTNNRFYITIDNFTSYLEKNADITSLFVRRSVFYAFWGGRNNGQNTDQHDVNSNSTDAQDQQMPDIDEDPNQDADTQHEQMSGVEEADQGANNPGHVGEVSVPAPVQETPPAGRSSALTTFISSPPSLELHNTSQPNLLQDSRMMTILIRQDGEWEEIKECQRCSIIDAIKEVRRDNPEQDWFLYNKDGRGITLEQCPTHEDDFVCLNTDSSGFPANLIL
ncbi:hypothetical protein F4802DRAFT_72080 [Xylaria palmicola]|nr:hypothetical protein F4802DRAFT_72080 [Xylaria palmicola]